MSTVPQRIEIPSFPGGKRIAVTTSWDDGRVYDHWVVDALNAWGMKGTFNLNSGKLTRNGVPTPIETVGHLDASEVADLFRGHEVAIHTVTHPWLERMDASQIATEVLEDRKALEDLVGYPVRGMAYPFGTYNQRVIEVLRALGIVYCRTVENSPNCFPPKEPLAWAATMHQYGADPSPLPQRWEDYYSNPRQTGVFFVWGHSFEFAGKGPDKSVEAILKPLSGKPDVWYCTNIELFDYEAARQRLVIAANRRTAYNPSAVTVTVKADERFVEVPGGQVVSLEAE